MSIFHSDPTITKIKYKGVTWHVCRNKKNTLPTKSFLYTPKRSLILLDVLDAVDGGKLIVYDGDVEVAKMSVLLTGQRVFLRKLDVSVDYRNDGIARQMMNHLVKWCQINEYESLEVYPSAPSDEVEAASQRRLNLAQLRDFYRSFGLTMEHGRNLYAPTDSLHQRHYFCF